MGCVLRPGNSQARPRRLCPPKPAEEASSPVCFFSQVTPFRRSGSETITPAQSGFLTGLYIPLVPLFGALIYRRAPRLLEVVGVGMAAVGMALLTLHGSIVSDLFHNMARGDLLTVACAACYACHILVLERVTATGDVELINIAQIATTGLIAASTFWWVETPRVTWTPGVWFALGVTSVFVTGLALAGQTWATAHHGDADGL